MRALVREVAYALAAAADGGGGRLRGTSGAGGRVRLVVIAALAQ
jgi:hypothetical protein